MKPTHDRLAAAFLALLLASACGSSVLAEPKDDAPLQQIQWTVGPAEADLGGGARLQVPSGYRFTGPDGARIWAQLCNNPYAGELGVLTPPVGATSIWYVLFSYDDVGHVSDD